MWSIHTAYMYMQQYINISPYTYFILNAVRTCPTIKVKNNNTITNNKYNTSYPCICCLCVYIAPNKKSISNIIVIKYVFIKKLYPERVRRDRKLFLVAINSGI